MLSIVTTLTNTPTYEVRLLKFGVNKSVYLQTKISLKKIRKYMESVRNVIGFHLFLCLRFMTELSSLFLREIIRFTQAVG